MRRKKENPFPTKTGPTNSGIFQSQRRADAPPSGMNPKAKNGTPHTGLTTNRQKPGGGPGSSGPITDVDAGY